MVVFYVYFPSFAAARKINTKIARELVDKQFVARVQASFHFLQDIRIHKWRSIYNIYTSSPCGASPVNVLLMTSQSVADGVTMIRLLWRDQAKSDIYIVRYRFYSWRYLRPVTSMSSGKRWAFCPGPNVLIKWPMGSCDISRDLIGHLINTLRRGGVILSAETSAAMARIMTALKAWFAVVEPYRSICHAC